MTSNFVAGDLDTRVLARLDVGRTKADRLGAGSVAAIGRGVGRAARAS